MAIYDRNIHGRHSSYGNENIISLAPELQRLVERNGLDAYISIDPSGQPTLNVRGNRGLAASPALHYKMTNQQMSNLMKGGTNYKNSNAYDTFNSIVKNDFMPPENYTVAKNSGINRHGWNSHAIVNMGWGGIPTVRTPFGFTTLEGQRTDGRRLPGESAAIRQLPTGEMAPTAGYIWRGNLQVNKTQTKEQTQNINIRPEQIMPTPAPRPERGMADTLSPVTGGNDNYEKNLKVCLESHGIIIREKKNQEGQTEHQLIIKPLNARKNFLYQLTNKEYALLTADHYNSIKDYPALSLDKRLAVINNKIKNDFNEPITTEMLKSKDYVDLTYKPGMKEIHEADFIHYDAMMAQKKADQQELKELEEYMIKESQRISSDHRAVDGRLITEIMEANGEGQKAFYQNISNGRQMSVSEIRVDKNKNENKEYKEATRFHQLLKYYGITPDMDVTAQMTVKKQIDNDYNKLDTLDSSRQLNGEKLTPEETQRKADLLELSKQMTERVNGRNNNIEKWFDEPKKENFPEKSASYKMWAQINGEWQSKDISKKEYRQFIEYDDAHKLKMFTDTFKEVKMADGTDYSLMPQKGRSGHFELTEKAIINLLILQNMKKAFYAEGEGGRQKEVSSIQVFNIDKAHLYDLEEKLEDTKQNRKLLEDLKKDKSENKQLHVIAAVIDGNVVQHAMTSKEYDKFMRSNDEQRLKIADKIFDEFKVKYTAEGRKERNERKKGTILGVLGAVAGVALAGTVIKQDIDRIAHGEPRNRQHGHYVNRNIPVPQHHHGMRYSDIAIAKYEYLIRDTQEIVSSLGRGL